ncbi:MAG: alpha,alpha-trehalase TreF [Bacteroidota bacterium]
MKIKILLLMVCLLVSVGCKQETKPVIHQSFYETQLFKDVQLAAIYPDSKTLVDLVPNTSYTILEEHYLKAREEKGFDLREFVLSNFTDTSMESLEFSTDTTKTMYEHIEGMWDKLTRGPDTKMAYSSRIPLPNTYVVPGGRFQEIYYWDSYFTLEGLLAAGQRDLAKNMVSNFAFLLDSIGHIPNGTRDYYLTRSQPPFFSLMVTALAREDEKMVLYYLPELLKEYEFFMDHNEIVKPYGASKHVVQMIGGGLLNRYWDAASTPRPEAYKEDIHLAKDASKGAEKEQLYRNLRSAAESGWDFSSRWYAVDGDFSTTNTTSLLPIDLNCLMYYLELQLSQAAVLQRNKEASGHFTQLANRRKALIREYFWDEELGFFMDFDFQRAELTNELTLAGAFPLFFGIASREQAEKIKTTLMTRFLKDGGLVTTLKNSGQQWDAPNGWAPLQWMAVNGLLTYGYEDEAKEIMERWLALNEKVFKDTGKMMEKYNVEDLSLLSGGGEYETQDGFGWTNGVALGFKELLHELESKKN